MELTQLQAFRVVAETLHFTRAAERLYLTQSAISQRIKSLETELGEPLFYRNKTGVTLTPSGRIALEHVRNVLDELDALAEVMRGRVRAPRGRLRVAAATQAFVHLFAPLFESFMRDHPAVELTFRGTTSTTQTLMEIKEGAADVGFASLPVYSPGLEITPLFEDELMVIVGAPHPLSGREEVLASELEQERHILFELGASIRRATDAFFDRAGIRPQLALESNDTSFIKLMVERGLGVSLLPIWSCREEVASGRLARLRVLDHDQDLHRSVAAVSLARFQSAPTRAFLAYVFDHRQQLQERALP
jgi:LysR family cyn operon transcriptional activator